jgi:ribose/xylose/arabinose/galactoside ABC-type transport system permease subunit
VATKFILATLSGVFLILGMTRLLRDGGKLKPAAKSWLWVGSIFGVVSLWLFKHV